MSKIIPLKKLEQWLDGYLNFEKTPKKDIFWLDTMHFLCKKLDNPQNAYKCVHIAGSKGKGSVSVFFASILESSHYKTGLFTSPHVTDISERVGSASGTFSNDVYETAFTILRKAIESIDIKDFPGERPPTWFELINLFAFVCFQKADVEWGVFETGLGGRLDSTNVLLPEVCIITPIELEHTEYLGDTLEKIATEKAGIFKAGVPIFSSAQVPNVRKVLEQRAKNLGFPIRFLDDAKEQGDCNEVFAAIRSSTLRMAGKIQYENAELAALAIKSILPNISQKAIIEGICTAFLPCRLEKVLYCIQNKTILLILDAAHTPNSLNLCLQDFFEMHGKNNHLLFACAADKDVEGMAKIIQASSCDFSQITITIPGAVKQANFERTKKAFASLCKTSKLQGSAHCDESIKNAMNYAAKENKALLVVGSFYLASAVKNLLESEAQER